MPDRHLPGVTADDVGTFEDVADKAAATIQSLAARNAELRAELSALKKQGVEEVAHLLWQWTHPEPAAQAGPAQ